MTPSNASERIGSRGRLWLLLPLIVVTVTVALVTVTEADDSLSAIESVRRLYADWGASAGRGKGVIVEYATEAISWDSTREVGTSRVWQAVSGGVSLVVSDEATLCSDSAVLVAVFPHRREILITDATGRMNPNRSADPMALVRDSVLRASTVTSDDQVKGEDGEPLRVIRLDVDQARTPGHRIDSMSIAFDPSTRMIKHYELAMTRDHPLRRVRVRWIAALSDTLSPELPSSPLALIYADPPQLQPRYSGYRVRDVRVSSQ